MYKVIDLKIVDPEIWDENKEDIPTESEVEDFMYWYLKEYFSIDTNDYEILVENDLRLKAEKYDDYDPQKDGESYKFWCTLSHIKTDKIISCYILCNVQEDNRDTFKITIIDRYGSEDSNISPIMNGLSLQ